MWNTYRITRTTHSPDMLLAQRLSKANICCTIMSIHIFQFIRLKSVYWRSSRDSILSYIVGRNVKNTWVERLCCSILHNFSTITNMCVQINRLHCWKHALSMSKPQYNTKLETGATPPKTRRRFSKTYHLYHNHNTVLNCQPQ